MSYAMHDMSAKICLVTGSTSGIGREVALELARLGAETIIASRNEEKCARTAEWIRSETGNRNVDYEVVDLSERHEIQKFADSIHDRYAHLDVLINNAGGFFLTRRENSIGLEKTFALNHLGYFMPTLLLLDLLTAGAPSRVINVASGSHRNAKMHFEDLQLTSRYRPFEAYGQSKLANILFTYELSRRLQSTGVTANVLHPGVVATNIASDNGILGWLARPFMHLIGRSPQEGADTPVYLATAKAVDDITGKYFVDCESVPSASQSYDSQASRRLWEISLQLAGLEDPLAK